MSEVERLRRAAAAFSADHARAIANWLDVTDTWALSVLKRSDEPEDQKQMARDFYKGKQMQNDLRAYADILDEAL